MSSCNNTKYTKEIKEKIIKITSELESLRQKLSVTKDNKEWFKIQSEINSKQVDLQTQKSRLENIGKRAYLPDTISYNTKIN